MKRETKQVIKRHLNDATDYIKSAKTAVHYNYIEQFRASVRGAYAMIAMAEQMMEKIEKGERE